MKVFATGDYYRQFADESQLSNATLQRFTNGELQAQVTDRVVGEDCVIIGSAAPPDEQFLTLLILANALKRARAKSIQAYMPYLGYGRQDKLAPGESGGIALVGHLLAEAGVDSAVTIDVHSPHDVQLFGMPLTSISSASLFAPLILQEGWRNATVLAPDEGAVGRAEDVSVRIRSDKPPTHLHKQRTDGIVHFDLTGTVGERVIIVDDILDTGKTLLSACQELKRRGVKEIMLVVTHGLFTGEAWKELFSLGVTQLLVSNSYSAALQQDHPLIRVVAIPSDFWKIKEEV